MAGSWAGRLFAAVAAYCVWLAAGGGDGFTPGDHMPAFRTATLNGPLTFGGSGGGSKHLPLLAVAFDPSDPFSRNMWLAPDSLAGLLQRSPHGVSYLFLSHGRSDADAHADAKWMRQQLLTQASALHLPPSQLAALLTRLHFATEPVHRLAGWLPQLLAQWQSPRRIMQAAIQPPSVPSRGGDARARDWAAAASSSSSRSRDADAEAAAAAGGTGLRAAAGAGAAAGEGTLSSGRLDAFYGWIPWPVSGITNASLASAGTDCDWLAPGGATSAGATSAGFNGSVVLISLTAFPAALDRQPAAATASDRNNSSSSGSSSSSAGSQTGGSSDDDGSRRCSYGRMLAAAQQAGAQAVVFAAPAGAELAEVNCTAPSECGTAIAVPVTMVPHSVGEAVRQAVQAGGTASVNFTEVQGPGLFAGLDRHSRLFEVGWLKFPSLMHAVWAAQWQAYLHSLHARLAEPALEAPIFDGATMQGEHGVRATLQLPSAAELAGLNVLQLDMALGCPGTNDSSCPVWDHVVQLFACCQDPAGQLPPCDPCQPTVWLGPAGGGGGGSGSGGGGSSGSRSSRGRSGGGGGSTLAGLVRASGRDGSGGGGGSTHARSLASEPSGARNALGFEPGPLLCGRELGRWMTPFRRRIGRWLTDVSHLQPLLLPGQQCTFTMQSTAWAGTWKPSLTLRYSSSNSSSGSGGSSGGSNGGSSRRSNGGTGGGAGTASSAGGGGNSGSSQAQLLPLPFNGGTFDSGYNSFHPPYTFTTPPGLTQAVIAAVITGHGSDENGCAEFCPTSHHFVVNGRRHSVAFPEAGTLWGCADKVLEGVEPNEHGTWAYGRNGWCDGQDVTPWVADVTASLAPAGQPNSIVYRGLYNGSTPHPQQPAGFIVMQSNLVLYHSIPSRSSRSSSASASSSSSSLLGTS